ncbi:MAG: ATP-binding cassette domain-containing protein [Lachnospiraceae bacterium]
MNIELRGVCMEFEGQQVLNAIHFKDEIHTLSIIGPSGGGKSTLLRILGGLLVPSSGELIVEGKCVEQRERALIAYRRNIGFVFQQGGLFAHLSARENIVLPLVQVHGFLRAEAENTADQLLGRFGLLEDSHKKPSALSGGQQQRIAIARAVAARPAILLLDEPTSALDPEYTTEVLDMISELKEDNIDFIIVTHEMGFARRACEKMAFLSQSSLLEYGNSTEHFANPKTPQLRKFLGKLLEWS